MGADLLTDVASSEPNDKALRSARIGGRRGDRSQATGNGPQRYVRFGVAAPRLPRFDGKAIGLTRSRQQREAELRIGIRGAGRRDVVHGPGESHAAVPAA